MMHTIAHLAIPFQFRFGTLLVLMFGYSLIMSSPVFAQAPDLTECCECFQDQAVVEEMVRDACQSVHGSNSDQLAACETALRQQIAEACTPTITLPTLLETVTPTPVVVDLPTFLETKEPTPTPVTVELNAMLTLKKGAITVIVNGKESEREGILVELDDGTETTTAVTNAEGIAEFSALSPGDYAVRLPNRNTVGTRRVILTEAAPTAEVQFDLPRPISYFFINPTPTPEPSYIPYSFITTPTPEPSYILFTYEPPSKEEVLSVLNATLPLFVQTLIEGGIPGNDLLKKWEGQLPDMIRRVGELIGIYAKVDSSDFKETDFSAADDPSTVLRNLKTNLGELVKDLKRGGDFSTVSSLHEIWKRLQDMGY